MAQQPYFGLPSPWNPFDTVSLCLIMKHLHTLSLYTHTHTHTHTQLHKGIHDLQLWATIFSRLHRVRPSTRTKHSTCLVDNPLAGPGGGALSMPICIHRVRTAFGGWCVPMPVRRQGAAAIPRPLHVVVVTRERECVFVPQRSLLPAPSERVLVYTSNIAQEHFGGRRRRPDLGWKHRIAM
ncbi:hypothetical protein BD289DRAFT_49070 [Coniella lustricola]|uniref:Uncharacterized protein n=1 Tax=Coniella lustricola TaxID=2025994 RepID=A0A2T3AIS7_9PEZI|nr:hypothetical protein BD289DRAFT_49070 [Coniella lustricola]